MLKGVVACVISLILTFLAPKTATRSAVSIHSSVHSSRSRCHFDSRLLWRAHITHTSVWEHQKPDCDVWMGRATILSGSHVVRMSCCTTYCTVRYSHPSATQPHTPNHVHPRLSARASSPISVSPRASPTKMSCVFLQFWQTIGTAVSPRSSSSSAASTTEGSNAFARLRESTVC